MTTTSPPSPTGSTDTNGALIGSLWAGAESLVSSYYPSETGLNIQTLTWPSTVVVDGSTIVLPETSLSTSGVSASSSATSNSASSATSSASKSANEAVASTAPASTSVSTTGSTGATATPASHTDKRLGIAIGLTLGLVALGVLFGVLFLLHRRRRRTGSFLRHQPPPDDGEIESWRGTQPSWQGSQSRIWADSRHPQHAEPVPQMTYLGPPREMVPAYMRTKTIDTSSSDSRSNPFYTPVESAAELEDTNVPRSHENQVMPRHDLEYHGQPQARANRPSTPLVHHMMQTPQSPVSPIEPQHAFGDYTQINPFSSPEDHEADEDLYGRPMPPAKSPDRRNSPQVHYPSGPEISNFDFGLANRHAGGWRASEDIDGGDGWRRPILNHGRHEMP